MKPTVKFRTAKYVLIIPAFLSAMIGMIGCFISLPIFYVFNPSYVLPDDKAGMEVAPVTSWFWKKAENYTKKYWHDPIQQKHSCVHPPQSRVITHRGQHCNDCGKRTSQFTRNTL